MIALNMIGVVLLFCEIMFDHFLDYKSTRQTLVYGGKFGAVIPFPGIVAVLTNAHAVWYDWLIVVVWFVGLTLFPLVMAYATQFYFELFDW